VSVEDESRWACPTCGERRLAMEELPRIGAMGAQPYSDILGMGDPSDRVLPSIVCLGCGRRWDDAEAFWAETRGEARTATALDAEDVTPSAPVVAILADDLIWASRLADATVAAGAEARRVRRVADLQPALDTNIGLVVVDLTARAYDGVEAVRAAVARGARVLAVGQHDDHELRRRALDAGAERVLAYRKLFEDGPGTIRAWLERVPASRA
jgi:CheY-like chemotaxis protein